MGSDQFSEVAFIGRTDCFSFGEIGDRWSRISRVPHFDPDRREGEYPEVPQWLVDHIYRVEAFSGNESSSCTCKLNAVLWGGAAFPIVDVERPGIIRFNYGAEFCPGSRGEIVVHVSGRRSQQSIVSVAYLPPELLKPDVVSVGSRDFYARLSPLLADVDIYEKHGGFHALFRAGASSEVCVTMLGFRYRRKAVGEIRLQGAQVELEVCSANAAMELVEKVRALWPEHELRAHKLDVGFDETAVDLDYLNGVSEGPWITSGYPAKEVWTAERFAVEGQGYDALPVGRLRFPGGIKGARLPSSLRRAQILVDLFRENEGWHFMFYFLEAWAGKHRRDATRRALNEYFGSDLVSRSAEQLWPEIFP